MRRHLSMRLRVLPACVAPLFMTAVGIIGLHLYILLDPYQYPVVNGTVAPGFPISPWLYAVELPPLPP